MSDANLPVAFDVRAFAAAAGRMQGVASQSAFERLAEEAQGETGGHTLRWSVQAEMRPGTGGAPEPWLHLEAETSIALTCQRCLGTVDVELDIRRSFRFVDTEDLAQAQDEVSEEDVLALSADFRLADLIEDEVLLALPLIPRHEKCPVPVRLSAEDPDFVQATGTRPNPFGVLAALSEKADKPAG